MSSPIAVLQHIHVCIYSTVTEMHVPIQYFSNCIQQYTYIVIHVYSNNNYICMSNNLLGEYHNQLL